MVGYYPFSTFRRVYDGSSQDTDATANFSMERVRPANPRKVKPPHRGRTESRAGLSQGGGSEGRFSSEVPTEQRPRGRRFCFMKTTFQTVWEEMCYFKDTKKQLTIEPPVTLSLSSRVVTKTLTRNDTWTPGIQYPVWGSLGRCVMIPRVKLIKKTHNIPPNFLYFSQISVLLLFSKHEWLLVNLASWRWLQDPRLYEPKLSEYSDYGGKEGQVQHTLNLLARAQRPPTETGGMSLCRWRSSGKSRSSKANVSCLTEAQTSWMCWLSQFLLHRDFSLSPGVRGEWTSKWASMHMPLVPGPGRGQARPHSPRDDKLQRDLENFPPTW